MEWVFVVAYTIVAAVVWFFVAKSKVEEERPKDGDDYFLLIIDSTASAAIWPAVLPYLGLKSAMKGMVSLVDKSHRSWEVDPTSPWCEFLTDDRSGVTVSPAQVRCRYCQENTCEREVTRSLWTPCPKEECKTLMSMDGKIQKILRDREEWESMNMKKYGGAHSTSSTSTTPYINSWTDTGSNQIHYNGTDALAKANIQANIQQEMLKAHLDSQSKYIEELMGMGTAQKEIQDT